MKHATQRQFTLRGFDRETDRIIEDFHDHCLTYAEAKDALVQVGYYRAEADTMLQGSA